jgi:hypothetical protein
VLQFFAGRFPGEALVLEGLFVIPADYQGTPRVADQVGVFSGGFYGVEDDFEIAGCGDADEGGLRGLVWREAGQNRVAVAQHEGVD